MPIYEYACPACNAEFEVLIRKRGDQPKTCPTCGKGKPIKAFSTFAVSTAGSRSLSPHCKSCPSDGDRDRCAAGGCPMAEA